MDIEFVDNKDKTKPKFKEGDIIAIKIDRNGIKTDKTNYYLIGKYNANYYCLINIKTGEMYMYQNIDTTQYLNKEELNTLIYHHDGKVYNGNKARLLIEKIQ